MNIIFKMKIVLFYAKYYALSKILPKVTILAVKVKKNELFDNKSHHFRKKIIVPRQTEWKLVQGWVSTLHVVFWVCTTFLQNNFWH